MITEHQVVVIPADVATSLQQIIGTEGQGDHDFQSQFDQVLGVFLAVHDLLTPKQLALIKEALLETKNDHN